MTDDKTIRVLVADDSAFMRKMIGEILRNAGMDVVATAFDGFDALQKTRQFKPDVITLDVEMPRMNGVEFLDALMKEQPTPVLVLSSLTDSGADATMQCLERGAYDCLHKPSGSISLNIAKMGDEIVKKVIEAVSNNRDKQNSRQSGGAVSSPPPAPLPRPLNNNVRSFVQGHPVVLIASSTGGPAALQRVVPKLSADLGAAVIIVQHLPVGFTGPLANRLNNISHINVREACEGERLEVGTALVAPAGKHLSFNTRGEIVLTMEPPLWGVRPAADMAFQSAAQIFRNRVVGAVLTGMGRDGALGARAIQNNGGICYAQDEASCVIFGMPRAAWEAGGVHELLNIDLIAPAIEEAVRLKLRKIAA